MPDEPIHPLCGQPGFIFARLGDGDGLCKARDECDGRCGEPRLA